MAIYQVKDKSGNAQKTKDGRSWYFRVYYTNKYGERKQRKSKLFYKKSEAQDAERLFLDKVSGHEEIDKDMPFSKVYYEWLGYKKTQLKITTYYNLERNTKKNIYNFFEKYKLHNININSMNEWMSYITKLKYSISYINAMIGYCREVFNYAKDNYDFDYKVINKIYNVREDSAEINNNLKNAEWNFWNYEEWTKFINAVDDEYYNLVFSFLYFTGLREGELFALCWNDVDFENKKLIINKSLTNKIGNKSFAITTPKTKNSNRIMDIDDQIFERLLKHYEEEKRIYNFSNDMFIFGNIKHMTATTLRRILYDYETKAKVKKITPHGFRHSHVSLLIDLGCDSRDVANRIGDTVQVVESTYIHMFPKKQSSTINKLNNFKK